MKDKIFKYIGYIGFVLILVLVVIVGAEVFSNGFSGLAKTEALIAAFSGAFFAYIFLKIGELFTRLYQAEQNNQKTIVELEHLMNVYMNKLHNNLFVSNDMINTINSHNNTQDISNLIKINFNSFKPVEFSQSNLLNLKNIDFVNDVFNFYADLEKVNDAMVSVQKFYDLLTTSMIKGDLDVDRYKANAEIVGGKLTELNGFIEAAREKAVVIASKSQVLHDQRPPLIRLVIRTSAQFYKTGFEGEVNKKLEMNKKNIKENESQSKKEIKKVLSKSKGK